MKVQDIELVGAAPQAIEHDQMIDERVLGSLVEPQRHLAARFQRGRGVRIATGEKRNLVPQLDQFLGHVGNHPLGTAVEPRRATFIKRRDLRDSHDYERSCLRRSPEDSVHHVNGPSRAPSVVATTRRRRYRLKRDLGQMWTPRKLATTITTTTTPIT